MNKVEKFENERATGYDKFVEQWIPNYHYFLDLIPNLLKEEKGNKILIVGCGTGNEIERLLDLPSQWDITGIDPSHDMIVQAQEKLAKHPNVHLIEGLVSDLKEGQKYNAATLLLVLHFLDDNGNKQNILNDIASKLEPDSPFILLDITGNKRQIQQNLNILQLILPTDIPEEQIQLRLNRIENELFAVSEERLVELCENAGFETPTRFFQSSIYMGWIMKKK